jgi:hypothetical protein
MYSLRLLLKIVFGTPRRTTCEPDDAYFKTGDSRTTHESAAVQFLVVFETWLKITAHGSFTPVISDSGTEQNTIRGRQLKFERRAEPDMVG